MSKPSLIAFCLALASALCTAAQTDIDIDAELCAYASSGSFAPQYLSNLTGGKVFQKNGTYLDVTAAKPLDFTRRFSWGAAAEVLAGVSNASCYQRWSAGSEAWTDNSRRPNPFTLQQLYAEVKYRGVFLTAGMKQRGSALLNQALSSGDLIESGNARPIPQVRIGFHHFVDIPFTQGWVQIQGEISYGRMTDYGFLSDRYNRYNGHITSGSFYNYKRCYFRTNPAQPFVVTVGMQGGSFFGGRSHYFRNGKEIRTERYSSSLSSVLNIIAPVFNSKETFAEGSTLGSWDLFLAYRLREGSKLCAYIQWPFEDGSGIGRRNKFDGVWGLEFKGKPGAIVDGVVLEYIDFRDQSGPIHYSPGDHPGSTITSEATGRDNYYNNAFYNAYANYGMAIGTPFLLSPVYNLNGAIQFACNRANGFHLGVSGTLPAAISYRILAGYQRGMGTYANPYPAVRHCTSAMVEASRQFGGGWSAKAQLAIDRGSLRGNSFGALLSVAYKIM